MDNREIKHQPWDSFDARNMQLLFTINDLEYLVPAVYEVCDVCAGQGKHTNPSIDGNGLSSDDFDEDPDFAEAYFSGTYDVICVGCQGLRVVPIPDLDNCLPHVKKLVQDHIDEYVMNEIESWHERRHDY